MPNFIKIFNNQIAPIDITKKCSIIYVYSVIKHYKYL